ncbi:amidohydrolase family protein [Thalassotalea aquiviva]|uniref:amidohydrolase family protein n=1 Tax=Thalassotalea aquiviva TaxID=3242415 RepID=UPI00352B5441
MKKQLLILTPRLKIVLLCGLFNLPTLASEQLHQPIQTITNNIYTLKGLAGKQVMTQTSANHYQGVLEVRWNNRVVEINEALTIDDQGNLIEFKADGISAFGAPIKERFEFQDGIARWSSRQDDGELKTDSRFLYLPANSAVVVENLMLKHMLASKSHSVDLLPSGTARLQKMDTFTLTSGDNVADLTLYAITGLGFSPEFSWYDQNGHFFAKDFSGFMKVIRAGYDLSDLAKLTEIQNQAEHQYLEQVSQELSNPYQSLVIRNVQVANIEKKQLFKDVDVWLVNGKIHRIGKQIKVAKNTVVIAGEGKTLLPGLWDMHGHLTPQDGLLNIAAGVTSVRDIGNNHDSIMSIEQNFHSNRIIGNNVYRAGFIDQMSEYSALLSVESLEQAHEKIDWFADNGYLQVKLYSSIDPSWVPAIAAHAHRRGMRLSGHIPAFMTAEQAVLAGYDEIQHINMLFLNFLASDQVDTRQQLRFSLIGEQAGALDLNSPEVDAFLQLLAQKQIVIDPTISTFRSLLLKQNKQVDPEFAAIAQHLPPNVLRQIKGAEMNVSADLKDNYQQGAKAMSVLVKKLYDYGVPLVAGTDNIAGFTLHRELELYAQAGIPNWDVLKIATLDSAKLIGVGHQKGSIMVGKDADLILIDGNPVQSMSDLRKVSLVVKGRHYYRPDQLYKVLGVRPFVASANVK